MSVMTILIIEYATAAWSTNDPITRWENDANDGDDLLLLRESNPATTHPDEQWTMLLSHKHDGLVIHQMVGHYSGVEQWYPNLGGN